MLFGRISGRGAIIPLIFAIAFAAGRQTVCALSAIHNVPPAVQTARDLGPVDPDADVTLTVYLNIRNQAAFDSAVEKLYDPESPTYHQWMTDQDLEKFAPTASDYATVQRELEKNGLLIVSTDPQNFSIRVHGRAADVEKAFQTQLRNVSLNGKAVRAHIQDAKLTGAAGNLIASVAGLDEHKVRPFHARAINPRTGLPSPRVPVSKVASSGGLGGFVTDQCFAPPSEFTFTTPGAMLPVGVYFGNVYNPVDSSGNPLACSFTPAQLQAHYGLDGAYKAGFKGSGQTIVLLEGYGYPTAEADANTFSELTGLPALTASNFEIVYPEGVPNPIVGVLAGWDVEIAMDIEWAHSMAPGAKIVVVATNGQDNEDFQASMSYIIAHKLGTVVSDSWGEDTDLFAGPLEQDSYNSILKLAAAKGISFQFSSGDSGDGGLGTPVGAPGVPANSPYATSVGGTSILNNAGGSGFTEVGWGTDLTLIASYAGTVASVLDPPFPYQFFGGAGGGESVYFTKPSWQRKLPGTGRQGPDISALADPYTGVFIVVTSNGEQYLEAGWGGTSLSSPIVTAFLAIATQRAGHALGQAAPLIASLPSGAVTDILPVSSPTNIAGTIFDSTGATFYSPSSLFAPFMYPAQNGFVSAIWPAGNSEVIAFDIDTSLAVTTGWDNVTGFGAPNGLTFINALAK